MQQKTYMEAIKEMEQIIDLSVKSNPNSISSLVFAYENMLDYIRRAKLREETSRAERKGFLSQDGMYLYFV